MRAGQTIWHSKRIKNNNATIEEYEAPVKYVLQFNYLSVMPASSQGLLEIMKYGEDIDKTWTMIANYMYFDGFFNEGDAVWVDGEEPIADLETKYNNGATATAIVKNVSYVNTTISITLTKNKGQILNED